MLNFQCTQCQTEIQSEYQYIGELVECPMCESLQIVPDPILQNGTQFHGYLISSIKASTMLWNVYEAVGISELKDKHVIIRVPTTFFLNNVSNFDQFVETIVKGGSFNLPSIPSLLDRSIIPGKVYFVYSYIKEAYKISYFEGKNKLDISTTLLIAKKTATTLDKLWDKEGIIYQNLPPRNIKITEKFEKNNSSKMTDTVAKLASKGDLVAINNKWSNRKSKKSTTAKRKQRTPTPYIIAAIVLLSLGCIFYIFYLASQRNEIKSKIARFALANKIEKKIAAIKASNTNNEAAAKLSVALFALDLINDNLLKAKVQIALDKKLNSNESIKQMFENFEDQLPYYEGLTKELQKNKDQDFKILLPSDKFQDKEPHLLLALVYLKQEHFSKSNEEFNKLPYNCGIMFTSIVTEKEAETIYKNIIKEIGLVKDGEATIFSQLSKNKLDPTKASKLKSTIAKFAKDFSKVLLVKKAQQTNKLAEQI